MLLVILRYTLVLVALALIIYVTYRVVRDRRLETQDALSVLGIIITIILALNIPEGSQYVPVPISMAGNDDIQDIFPEFKVGRQTFGDVPFVIGAHNNKATSECLIRPGLKDWPSELTVLTNGISDPMAIYILINAGYTSGYQNHKIGVIELHFTNGNMLFYDLILGQNIREWRIEHSNVDSDVVTTLSNSYVERAVYYGLTDKGDVGVLDMLELSIAKQYRGGVLESIKFRDTAIGDPCFFFVGITVKLSQ